MGRIWVAHRKSRARFDWLPSRAPLRKKRGTPMEKSAGFAAVVGLGVMLVCFMLDLPLWIAIPAFLATMAFWLFKGESFSKRRQDNRLFLPNEEPPPNVNS